MKRVTLFFDKSVNCLIKKQKVTFMIHTNNPTFKSKAGLFNLVEELANLSR